MQCKYLTDATIQMWRTSDHNHHPSHSYCLLQVKARIYWHFQMFNVFHTKSLLQVRACTCQGHLTINVVWDTENILYLSVRTCICREWRWTLPVGRCEFIVSESMQMRNLFDYFKNTCKTMSKYALHEEKWHMSSKPIILRPRLNCIIIVFKQYNGA
jgi:hypothetical protein